MADTKRGVSMPDDIALDPVQSAIWEELAPDGNNGFTEQDVPNLRLLCFWHLTRSITCSVWEAPA